MATGLESAFDQQEDDVFAIDSSAPTTDIPNYGAGSGYRGEPSRLLLWLHRLCPLTLLTDFGRISGRR